MLDSDRQSGETADDEQLRDTPPRDELAKDDPAKNTPAKNTSAKATSRQWPIAAIIGHRADPDDAARLQFRIRWAEAGGSSWSPTWEPECTIRLDAPHHKHYMLKIVKHQVMRHRQGETAVAFEVQWEGAVRSSRLSKNDAGWAATSLVHFYAARKFKSTIEIWNGNSP
ncbi:hypothetical protein CcaCcLH18_14255 [Colletotrichum camelliae]|nr:hypothetical protein CcaCcLH18_14255 [Colletotrichum camelliae]